MYCIVPHILFMVAPGKAECTVSVQDGKKFYGLEYLQSDQNMGSHTGLGTNYLLELRHPRVKNDVGIVNMRKINVWLIRDKDQWEIIKVIC